MMMVVEDVVRDNDGGCEEAVLEMMMMVVRKLFQ